MVEGGLAEAQPVVLSVAQECPAGAHGEPSFLRLPAFFAAVLVLSALVCLVNPNGVRGALYPLDYVGGRLDWATEEVMEFKSPNWHADYMRGLELLLLLTYAFLAVSPRSPALFDLTTVLLGTVMALKWGRNGPLLAALACPVLAVHVTAWVDTVALAGRRMDDDLRHLYSRFRVALRLPMWAALVALAVCAARSVPDGHRLDQVFELGHLPVKAAEVVAMNDLKGNMFSVYHWGGYLIWRFYMERPVFIDGRADVYGKAMWDDYRVVSTGGADWKRVLDKHHVEYIIADAGWPILRAFEMWPAFTRIYSDSRAAVYVRTGGANAEVIKRYGAGKLKVPKDDQPNADAVLWTAGQ